jgi:hypothetical protein
MGDVVFRKLIGLLYPSLSIDETLARFLWMIEPIMSHRQESPIP